MKDKLAIAVSIAVTWIVLTSVILAIDCLGVRVLNRNGLVFNVLVYWYGLSEFFSLLAFWAAVHCVTKRKVSILSTIAVLVLTGLWWLLTFCILMQTHGAIGGWY